MSKTKFDAGEKLDEARVKWKTASRGKRAVAVVVALLIFAVLGNLLTSCVAKAQDVPTYAPVQNAHDGLWYDPAFDGQGLDLRTYGPGDGLATVRVYVGEIDTRPVWAYANFPLGFYSVTADLFYTNADWPDNTPETGPPQRVGFITLTGGTCGNLSATVELDGSTHLWSLTPLLQPRLGECYSCPGVDFGPTTPGCPR